MGAAAERVRVTGNLKYDVRAGEADGDDGADRLSCLEDVELVVAGSTHGGRRRCCWRLGVEVR